MSIALPYTLYSHLHASTLRTPRWDEDGVRHYFYKSADAAREAVHQLLSEVAKDPEICGNEFELGTRGSSRVDLQACKLGTGRRFTTS